MFFFNEFGVQNQLLIPISPKIRTKSDTKIVFDSIGGSI